MTSVVRKMMALSLALAALLAGPAFALDTGDIVVENVKGDVRVTMNGSAKSVRAGGVLELPATIDTGRDGAIDLRQGATTISVGPETRLEFPALEQRGGAIDRIVQPRGNAFYSIGKRAGRRLRVETPYLVGVIKGTQFNVAAQDEATTISLFEGLLEIRASDDSSVIDLKAGEIASRKRGGKSISVIKMEGGITPPVQRGPAGPGGGGSQAPATSSPERATNEDSLLADRGSSGDRGHGSHGGSILTSVSPSVVETVRGVADAGATVDAGVDLRGNDAGANVASNINMNAATANVDVSAGVNVGSAVGVDLDAGVSAGGGTVSVAAGVGLDVGAASVEVGAATNVNLGAGAVDLGANVAVDAGALSADVGAAANVDLGAGAVDVGASAAIDAGPVTADAGAGVAVDVGAGSVAANVDLSAGADVGNVAAVDAGAGAAIDLGTNVDVAANVDVGANAAGVGAAVNAGVDVAAGNVDLGVSVAGVDLGLGLDLGLDNANGNDTGTNQSDTGSPGTGGGTTPPATTPVIDVGGLLDGILNRQRKK
jgi:hypothetical protein